MQNFYVVTKTNGDMVIGVSSYVCKEAHITRAALSQYLSHNRMFKDSKGNIFRKLDGFIVKNRRNNAEEF